MTAHVAVLAYNLMDLEDWKDEHPELAAAVIGVSLSNGRPIESLRGVALTSFTYTDSACDHPEFLRVSEFADYLVARRDLERDRREANRFVRAGADMGAL